MNNSLRPFCILFLFTLLVPFQSLTASDLRSVENWGYLLQNVTVQAVMQSPFDLVVIEPQLETADRVFGAEEVQRMKQRPSNGRERILLAYLSIGEAEDYRHYWHEDWEADPPEWLGRINPDWPGNYKVRYWYKPWQEIILTQLKKIQDAGFDGVYLDIVDAWEYWSNRSTYEDLELRYPNDPYEDPRRASLLMLNWLERIYRAGRINPLLRDKEFYLFPQNGELLLQYLEEKEQRRYWQIVDGIGAEDLFFHGELAENNAFNPEEQRLEILERFVTRGKIVLNVEYLTHKPLQIKAYSVARKYGFIPYCGVRMLDRFIEQPR